MHTFLVVQSSHLETGLEYTIECIELLNCGLESTCLNLSDCIDWKVAPLIQTLNMD